jgi:hypothetical protein
MSVFYQQYQIIQVVLGAKLQKFFKNFLLFPKKMHTFAVNLQTNWL